MSVELTDGKEFAIRCAQTAADKKAGEIVVLDLRGISTFTDFFVICSGTSEPQIKAIGSAIREFAREEGGRKPLNEDGAPGSQWIAVDFGDIIVHVFHEERRGFYDLEALWKDAPAIEWQSGSPSAPPLQNPT